MNTLLTSPSMMVSASRLRSYDLHKQLIDYLKIGRAIRGRGNPEWRRHPAVMMWHGHEQHLYYCVLLMHHDWLIRIGKSHPHIAYTKFMSEWDVSDDVGWTAPHWANDPRVWDSRKAELIRDNPKHYGAMWPEIDPDLPMFWPTLDEDYGPHFYNV